MKVCVQHKTAAFTVTERSRERSLLPVLDCKQDVGEAPQGLLETVGRASKSIWAAADQQKP